MRPPLKLALIGGEVTLLVAFTGVGIHLAMQPHRAAFRPPPLVLPSFQPPVLPVLPAPAKPVQAPAAVGAIPATTPFAPALFAKFGEQDRNLLLSQWDILQRLTGAIERYVESHLLSSFPRKS